MDRLARSLVGLEQLVDELTSAGVAVEFVKERHTFAASSNDPFATFQRQLIGAVAELHVVRAQFKPFAHGVSSPD